jgi:NitT/TauT family transport system ATP-binding protein
MRTEHFNPPVGQVEEGTTSANRRDPDAEALRFENVTQEFPGIHPPAIQDVSFQVDRGRFVAVIGPSGCGKSTILNLAAGLLSPTRGEVYFGGERVSAVNSAAAYVTQQANLLPWLSVKSNIGLALKFRKVPKAEREDLIADWVESRGPDRIRESFSP